MKRIVAIVVCAGLLGCGGEGAAELVCSSTDGGVVSNDKYTCDEWCTQGDELLTQATEGCGGEGECNCTFAPGETCTAELEGQECVL